MPGTQALNHSYQPFINAKKFKFEIVLEKKAFCIGANKQSLLAEKENTLACTEVKQGETFLYSTSPFFQIHCESLRPTETETGKGSK